MIVYICGGYYKNPEYVPSGDKPERVFGIVGPSYKTALPYVTDAEGAGRLYGLCCHHSHLYTVDTETRKLAKHLNGDPQWWEPAPDTVPDHILEQINEVIRRGELWSVR